MVGTWYLNANAFPTSVRFVDNGGTYSGALTNEAGGLETVDSILLDNPVPGLLKFRRNGNGFWQWYRVFPVDGTLTGRFSNSTTSAAAPNTFGAYVGHVTGWDEAWFPAADTSRPVAWELLVNNAYH